MKQVSLFEKEKTKRGEDEGDWDIIHRLLMEILLFSFKIGIHVPFMEKDQN